MGEGLRVFTRPPKGESCAWLCHSPILAHSSPSPLSQKTSDTQNLNSIRKEEILRNEQTQNLSDKKSIESKADSQVYENSESSSTESKSEESLESSFLESHSHEYSLNSHNLLFAQKKKGCYPLPAPLSPEKDKAPLFFFGNQGESLALSASSAIVAEGTPASFFQRLRTTKWASVGMCCRTHCLNLAKPCLDFLK